MKPNPVLKKLGFSDTDRLAIIHTDDIGNCQASLTAFKDLFAFGLISSGSVMVPCPWFNGAAEMCRSLPGVDMGVHITLTSEYDDYRWGPISTRDRSSGLLDEEGYFHHRAGGALSYADPFRVQLEILAQIDRALHAGIDVTHIDTHMGAIAHQNFQASYIQAAIQHHLPAMIPRMDAAAFERLGIDPDSAQAAAQTILALEEQGLPLIDKVIGLPLDQPENRLAIAKKLISELPVGVTHFILHPSADTPELRAMTSSWPSRVADYEAFQSEALRQFVRDQGIQVIGYRHLRNLL